MLFKRRCSSLLLRHDIGIIRLSCSGMQMAILSAYLILPTMIYLIPKELIFDGNTLCLFKSIFDIECFGCGMTRAIYLLLHGDINGAVGYNWRVIIVMPLLLTIYIDHIWCQLTKFSILPLKFHHLYSLNAAARTATFSRKHSL
ncbi:MAG: DUF2752 domain-containing protein [Rikenellaceae bacterium]